MANNKDLNSGHPDTIVITSAETLKAAFMQWAEEHIRRRDSMETLLDEASVQRRLGKSRATLWRWNNSGFLTCRKVGGRNCYLLADVERIEQAGGGRRTDWPD